MEEMQEIADATDEMGEVRYTGEMLYEQFKIIRDKWNKKFVAQTLHQQQQRRLYAAIKAAFCVEKKTFIDLILKETTMHVVKGRDLWIRDTLLGHSEILEHASEDSNITRLRDKLLADIEAFKKCKAEVDSMVHILYC